MEITIQPDGDDVHLGILFPGGYFKEACLSKIPDEVAFTEEAIREAIKQAANEIAARATEAVIEQIPAVFFGDPIIGCLIRSGLSSIVGQSETSGKAGGFPWGLKDGKDEKGWRPSCPPFADGTSALLCSPRFLL